MASPVTRGEGSCWRLQQTPHLCQQDPHRSCFGERWCSAGAPKGESSAFPAGPPQPTPPLSGGNLSYRNPLELLPSGLRLPLAKAPLCSQVWLLQEAVPPLLISEACREAPRNVLRPRDSKEPFAPQVFRVLFCCPGFSVHTWLTLFCCPLPGHLGRGRAAATIWSHPEQEVDITSSIHHHGLAWGWWGHHQVFGACQNFSAVPLELLLQRAQPPEEPGCERVRLSHFHTALASWPLQHSLHSRNNVRRRGRGL